MKKDAPATAVRIAAPVASEVKKIFILFNCPDPYLT